MIFLVLIGLWLVLFVFTFRSPGAPRLSRLVLFLLLLGVTGVLAYEFAVEVLEYNPNPAKVELAHTLTEDKLIDLATIAPGIFDLGQVQRLDTDGEEEGDDAKDPEARNEWLVFYRYDVVGGSSEEPEGPFGAAIYDHDNCRPPAILSFELVPVSYDYLGEDDVKASVGNVIPYADPRSTESGAGPDRPEVVITGYSRGFATDLNLFRKTGIVLSCAERRKWLETHPGQPYPPSVRYENVGSFRASYLIERSGATVTVVDRAGFERSQLTVRKVYHPQDGSYFKPGTSELLPPDEYTLAFGPGQPDQVSETYYPEKAVLAFYLALGQDRDDLERAYGYLSPDAQQRYNIQTDTFGLSADRASVARARDKLDRVLVWEIRYQADPTAEQLYQDRQVTVRVVGVNPDGKVDTDHPCDVTWTVKGVPRRVGAQRDYEWRLDEYESTCPPRR